MAEHERQMAVSPKILKGLEEIKTYMRIGSLPKLREIIAVKSWPGYVFCSAHCVHVDDLDDWMRKYMPAIAKMLESTEKATTAEE